MQRIYGWSRILSTGAPAPSCTVTVYDTGTLNLATIYADNILTPKANPFTADATSGYWFFYAASTGRYDVRFSGGGIVTPYTIGDVSTAGLLSLNGLVADTQTFAVGTAGTDFAVSSAGSTHTFNLPSASAANRGVVTTGAQTFAGPKTFTTAIAAGSGGTGLTTAPSADGQLLIGSAGGVYALATLTPTANQTTVTNGAGSVTIGTVQSIGTGSSPTFTGLTLSGLTPNAFMYPGAGGAVSATAAATDGQVLIGRTGSTPLAATLTAGTGVTITNGAGTITISSTGAIGSLNGLSASSQSFAVGTAGSDFAIVSAVSTHTFNIPDASSTARGLVTTGSQTIAGAKTLSGAFVNSSSTASVFGAPPTFTAGTGAAVGTAVGVISSQFTSVGNVGAGEDDLMSFSLPANTLAANGNGLRITCFGRLGAFASTKTVRLYFGAASIMGAFSASATNNGSWFIIAELRRTDGTNQRSLAQTRHMDTSAVEQIQKSYITTATETLSGAVTVKCTGSDSGSNTDGVIQDYMLIEFLK